MPHGIPRGAMCVQRFDDSLNSAIHTTYRISLRPSSTPESTAKHSSRRTSSFLPTRTRTPTSVSVSQRPKACTVDTLDGRPGPSLVSPRFWPCGILVSPYQIRNEYPSAPKASPQGPTYPTLRANPFPEVTDLICQLFRQVPARCQVFYGGTLLASSMMERTCQIIPLLQSVHLMALQSVHSTWLAPSNLFCGIRIQSGILQNLHHRISQGQDGS